MGSPSSSLVCSLILTHLPLCLLAHPLEGILQLLLFLLHIPLGLPGHCNLLGHLCILAASENEMSSPWCQGAQLVEGMLAGGAFGEPTLRSRSAWFCTSSLYFSFSLLYRCSLACARPATHARTQS